MDEQEKKRLAAIEAVRQAWNSLAEVAPEHPGELVDVAHVLVLDGEGDRVDAAVAIVRKGRISRAATQGLGEGFENACDMLAQLLLLRSSLLRATEASPPTVNQVKTSSYRLPNTPEKLDEQARAQQEAQAQEQDSSDESETSSPGSEEELAEVPSKR